MNERNILVDMSATIIHHGHIRLLKKAKRYGKVIVALTTDKEIKKYKKINTFLNYSQRKEILNSIKYVYKVIPSKWKITNKFLKKNKIDLIVRGNDHKNDNFEIKKKIFPRTKGISSSLMRNKIK
tara:strand:- start:740 stop:1114 length:375 start_codon:yes stop_codon:yes gene_type:complete